MTFIDYYHGQVGTALKSIFQSRLGINPKKGCNCANLARQMDEWGIDGCKARRTRIVADLKKSQSRFGWADTFAAALRVAASADLAMYVARHPFNPLMGVVDAAIDKAQEAVNEKRILYTENQRHPFTGPITRNLLFFILPVRGNEWRRNVELVLRRRHLFNGVRTVAISQEDRPGKEHLHTESLETVLEALKPLRANIITVRNNIGEVDAFRALLDTVNSTDNNTITYYCHAKGVTKQGNPGLEGAVQHWTNAMHEALLDGVDEAEDALESHAFAGCFRALGRPFGRQFRSFANWHYNGTMFWFRNSHVFALPNWSDIKPQYYGTEMWPGCLVPVEQSAFLMADRVGVAELYDPGLWKAVSQPRVDAWRERRIGRRKHIMHQSCYDAAAEFVTKYLADRPALNVADVGSYDHNGTVKALFQREGWVYTGIDVVPGPNVDVVATSHYDWSNVPSDAFDVVVSLNTVEHVPCPWKWIREVARIAKPGALVFITVPHTIPYHAYPVDCWRVWPDGMRGLLEEGGIEPITVEVASNDTVAVGRVPG